MVAALGERRVRSGDRSRYVPGGGIENWPLHRKITSLVAIALAKPLTPVRDITSGFFLVRRRALESVELDPIGFKIGLEVIAKGALRTRARSAVRVHRSRRRHVEAQSERDPQLLAPARPHLSRRGSSRSQRV